MEYIKPWSDIFIKYLFGTPENNEILLAFVNAVLTSKGYDRIVSVQIVNPFSIKDFSLDKESILDVKAIDENKRMYDIEIQSSESGSYVNRILYYWSTVYASQLKETEVYGKLKPVISINMLNFTLFESIKEFHSLFILKEKDIDVILTDHLSLHFIELPKLHQIHSTLEKFLYFIKNEGKEDAVLATLIGEDILLNKAHNQYKKFTSDEEMRDLYLRREIFLRDKLSAIEDAREKGIKEGKLEDARKMLSHNLTIELITDVTGLTIDEVKSLKCK